LLPRVGVRDEVNEQRQIKLPDSVTSVCGTAVPLALCACFTLTFTLGMVWALSGVLIHAVDRFGPQTFVDQPHAITSLGTLRGVRQNAYTADDVRVEINAFLGVPYPEQQPEGDMRFRAVTVQTTRYQKILSVEETMPICFQGERGDFTVSVRAKMSEACLYMNVWTPSWGSTYGSDRLPVMVYVHGGGLQVGSGSSEWFNGANLAATANAVVVTVNYRLGPLGFLVGANDREDEGNGGMNGFNDIIVALQWLQGHVGAFGGDANRVTLIGQGCGAVAVCTLGASPRAQNLFQSMVLQSGSCSSQPTNIMLGLRGFNYSQEVLFNLDIDTLDELLEVEPWQLVWPEGAGDGKCMAFVDNWMLHDTPYNMYIKGHVNAQRVVVGATSMDSLDLTPIDKSGDFVPLKMEEYEPALQRVFGDALGSLAISRYPLSLYKNNTAAAFIQAYADAMVVCPSIAFVTMLQSLMAIDKVYHYIFAYGPEYTDQAAEMRLVSPMQKTSRHWASHGAELPFLFHNMCRRCIDSNSKSCKHNQICVGMGEWSESSRKMSNQMIQYWAGFARGESSPRANVTGHETRWKSVSEVGVRMPTLFLDQTPTPYMQLGYRASQCSFWNANPPPDV